MSFDLRPGQLWKHKVTWVQRCQQDLLSVLNCDIVLNFEKNFFFHSPFYLWKVRLLFRSWPGFGSVKFYWKLNWECLLETETIRSGIWFFLLKGNHRACDCFLSAGNRQRFPGLRCGALLFMAEQAARTSAYLLQFSLPLVLCGWCDVAQMSALYEVGLGCGWETLRLGNPLLLEQAVSKPAPYPWGATNPLLKVTTPINYPAAAKEQTVMRKLSVKAGLVANQPFSGDQKSSEKTSSVMWVMACGVMQCPNNVQNRSL